MGLAYLPVPPTRSTRPMTLRAAARSPCSLMPRTNSTSPPSSFIYKGEIGNFQSDVNLKFNYWPNRYNELGNRSSELRKPYISGTIGNDLVMGGDKFHGFIIHSELDVENGVFEVTPQFGYGEGIIHSDGSQQGEITPNVSSGTGTIKGVLSNDGTKGHSADALPNYLAGEVKVTGFSKNGESGEGNQLVGVFVGEKQ